MDFRLDEEKTWYGESPKPVGPTGHICQKESPALFINSKIENALSPKFPIPTCEGREDICKNRPAARLFNQGAVIILIRHNAYCTKIICHFF